MKIKDLYINALGKYKKHILNSWIISLICVLLIGSLALSAILSDALILVFVPILILPIFFACVMSHAALGERDELSFGNVFGFYRLFFKFPFFSSFSIIRSFLKSFAIYLVLGTVVSGICYTVYARSDTFVITINQIIEQLKDASITNEQFQAYLEANNNELENYLGLTNGISFLIFSFFFIFFVLREEITIFIRMQLRNVPLAGQIARTSIRANYGKFNKYFFIMNWPILVIILLGMIIGVLLSTLVFKQYNMVGAIGLSIGVVLSVFFLPFYFANQEAIYEGLSIDIGSSAEKYIQDVFSKFDNKSNKEEKENVEGVKKDSDDTESK